MITRSFREQQFFLSIIIISRVLRSFIILNRTKKTVLYNPVLVFLIYLHQTHHVFRCFIIIIYLIWKSHFQNSIRSTWCALSRFHAPKDAELNLKKILFCDIAKPFNNCRMSWIKIDKPNIYNSLICPFILFNLYFFFLYKCIYFLLI